MIKTDIEYDLIPTFFHRGLVLVFSRMELCPEGVYPRGYVRGVYPEGAMSWVCQVQKILC